MFFLSPGQNFNQVDLGTFYIMAGGRMVFLTLKRRHPSASLCWISKVELAVLAMSYAPVPATMKKSLPVVAG